MPGVGELPLLARTIQVRASVSPKLASSGQNPTFESRRLHPTDENPNVRFTPRTQRGESTLSGHGPRLRQVCTPSSNISLLFLAGGASVTHNVENPMRSFFLALPMVIGISLSLEIVDAASPVLVVASGADEASIRAFNSTEVADFMAADTKGLDGLWANSFIVTNPLNQLATKSQVLGMVNSGILRFASYDRKIEYVRTYGDIAIVAGAETVVWAGKMPLAGKLSNLRFTAVWQRSGTGWREVARHANIVPEH